MEEKDKNNGFSIEQILNRIQSLEDRLSKIESKISFGNSSVIEPALETVHEGIIDDQQELEEDKAEAFFETNVGKYGLGWLANIVFIFGVTFVIAYIQSIGYPVLSVVLGFAGVLGMFIFAYLIKNAFSYIAFLVNVNAFLLLFYITASLHFFSSTSILPNKAITIFLLFLVIGTQLYFAIRRNSEALAGVGIVMLLTTAVFSNATHVMLPVISLAAIAAVYFFIRYEWWRILILTIILVYFAHLLWLFNNPFMGHEMKTVDSHQYNLIYLLFYAAVFSLPMIFGHWKKATDVVFVSIMFLNAIGFFITALLVIIPFYPENYVWIFGLITVVCLLYSVALKLKSTLRYTPAFYACYGFIALSVAIYGYYDLPNSYLLLALESLLVVSIAIWYRSTIIVVVNTLLFLFLLLFYVTTTSSVDSINFTFAFAGLATARILSWKKERLSLRTEFFQNFYLLASFILVLYALYHIVPSQYVTLTWTGAAGVYFLFSFILKNVKYRWMAIGTFLVTAFYLFFVDLKNMDMGYRVIAFLFLAVISLGVSLYYAKRLTKKPK